MRNLKKVLALVLAMAMSLSLAVTAGAAFKDGDKIADKYATAVEFAAQTGILEGFEDGTYGPQKNLTRAQLATMTYRIATGDVEDVYTADFAGGAAAAFTDTAATAWYAGYVGYAADAGYLKGVGDNLYKPNSAMTGYQALAAFLRVVGYNQPGQFTGADWTVQVAMIANEIGALEGITNVDLNAAISREVAAQIIFNILFADLVDYTPAFGYQNAWGEGSLATDIFDIVDYKADAPTAPWGQPAQQWYTSAKKDNVAVSIPYAPVEEYTTAVSECDLAKDLGLTEDFGDDRGEKMTEYKNGAIGRSISVVEGAINLLDTTTKIGAQGTLTEVYEVEGDYWFVQIETFLAKCVDTDEAVLDKNGHVQYAADAEFDIYCAYESDFEVETTDFEKDDYVLVNISKYDAKSADDFVYYLTETAPVATSAELTYKSDVNEYSKIGGETYNWAAHYENINDNVKPGYVNHEYDVFVDFYGNLIGLFVPAAADPVYAVLDRGVAATTGFNSEIQGDLVDLEGNVAQIVIDSYDAWRLWTEVEKPIHDIVKYEVNEAGEYEMTKVDSTEYDRYIIKKGESNIAVYDFVRHGWDWDTEYTNVRADDETIFVVETKHADGKIKAEYEVYVGYKAVPSMYAVDEIEVFYEDSDAFADIIYVDATAATVLNGEALAYVMPAEYEGTGTLENDVRYNTFSGVVINGEAVEVMANDDVALNLLAPGMYTLRYDENGLVEEVIPAAPFEYVTAEVSSVSGNEFVVSGTSFEVTGDTIIWVIDGDDAKVGTMADIEKNADILFKADYETTTAEFVIVFAD